MKVDLQSIDQTQFMVHEHILNGEVVYLVQPQHIGCNWTQENKIFRSSVWNAQGELISAGFPKFVNWGEKPEVFPVPKSLDGCDVLEKLDGSLLIVSKYKGKHILRTRGTVDAHKLDNGYELEVFENEILPNLQDTYTKNTWDFSLLFEWLSPVNKIVLNYGDNPMFKLIGCVRHHDYSLTSQSDLNMIADLIGLLRPQVFTFKSVEDLMSNVDLWKGLEGVCIYSKNGQEIHKCKSAWYLVRHRMKSELSNIEKTLEFWFANGMPDYAGFQKAIIDFDFELWDEPLIGFVSRICDAWKEVVKIEAGMKKFLTEQVLTMPTRKLQAVVITQSYGNTNRASFVFTLLDGKPLGEKEYKKLMWQVLKK